jgi:hypothetical protein
MLATPGRFTDDHPVVRLTPERGLFVTQILYLSHVQLIFETLDFIC